MVSRWGWFACFLFAVLALVCHEHLSLTDQEEANMKKHDEQVWQELSGLSVSTLEKHDVPVAKLCEGRKGLVLTMLRRFG